ncbi:SPP1 family phage portal protein [Natranaerovirga pectinivora]|uniref:SPP1 family phage portal protein n=1 Tax=Natranaerovirga pectinivora TaxID=682400 RepID=A0A4R3MN24_9FIRM|nr:phage portal protein [Natranaerovirga pectinivora]TCT16395.1 SPP1 family phage portal protein [Natranaerovirga pectinivora]
MTQQDLILLCLKEHKKELPRYTKMRDYYDYKHDILYNYPEMSKRNNLKVIKNFIQLFCDQEVIYTVGNDLTYISKKGDKEEINAIDYNLAHWNKKHDQQVLLEAEIYGESYELFYVNNDLEFCSRILNPTNSFCLRNEKGEVELFIHMWSTRFTNEKFIDVYDNDKITQYKFVDNEDLIFISEKEHMFRTVPVGVCTIKQTIYNKIKILNDSYNQLVSDQINMLSDLRQAYLVFTGVDIGEEQAKEIRELGIIVLPHDGKAEFLVQNVQDQHVKNMIERILDDIHQMGNSPDLNQELHSNLSGHALRNRLLACELRCNDVADSLINCVTTRVKFLFQFLKLTENKDYSYKDIHIRYTPNIPNDIVGLSDAVSKLKDIFPHETLMELFSFAENPSLLMEKKRKEQEMEYSIELDKLKIGNEELGEDND